MWFTIAAILAAGAQIGDPSKDFVLVGDKAYGFFLPVQVVSEAVVTKAAWSPSGGYVILERRDDKLTSSIVRTFLSGGTPPTAPPVPELSLAIWNKRTGRTTPIWKEIGRDTRIQELTWLSGTEIALVLLVRTEQAEGGGNMGIRYLLLEVDAASARAKVLMQAPTPSGSYFHCMPHPKLPLAAIAISEDVGLPEVVVQGEPPPGPRIALVTYRPSQGLGRRMLLPAHERVYGWHPGGDGFVLSVWPSQPDADGRRRPSWVLVDLDSGRRSPCDPPWDAEAPPTKPGGLRIVPEFESVRSGSLTLVYLLGTDEKQPRALVTAEAEYASLSPAKDGVLYVTRGVALFRPLLELPKDAFEKALLAAKRAEALSRAKQVALGLIIYAADHDDVLPSSSADWQNLIAPYLKNNSIMQDFVYTFGGGLLTAIERPAETELGYIPFAGGRIVAYADGHVRWMPGGS